MTQKNESQRQDRVAAWSRHAESELSAYQSAAKLIYKRKNRATTNCAPAWKRPSAVPVYATA